MNANIRNDEVNIIDFETQTTRYYIGKNGQQEGKYIEIDDGDINFPVRLQASIDAIIEYVEKRKKRENEIKETGAEIRELVELVSETDKFVKSKIDEAFNSQVSDVVFGVKSSMSVDDEGNYYFEKFLNMIIPIIEGKFDVRLKKVNAKAQKYMNNKGKYAQK